MGNYDVAIICRNGHTINDSSRKYPARNKKYCAKCGAIGLNVCEFCQTPIQGEYHADGVFGRRAEFPVPSYCHECGKPFPWTSAAIAAAKELADEFGELESSEREQLKAAVDDLATDSPRTRVAEQRYLRIIKKVGAEGAAAMRDILVDVASETVKKTLFGL